jgi:hypothetical protein
MFNRVSALWLVLGVLGGYVVAGPSPVKADEKPRGLPYTINPGDKVQLTFAYGSIASRGYTLECTVADTRDSWLRCATPEGVGAPPEQRWYDLNRIVEITKQEQ